MAAAGWVYSTCITVQVLRARVRDGVSPIPVSVSKTVSNAAMLPFLSKGYFICSGFHGGFQRSGSAET